MGRVCSYTIGCHVVYHKRIDLPQRKSFYPILICLCICIFIATLDTVIIAASLPAIASSLKATSSEAYWCGSGFLFARTVAQPIYGGLAETFGIFDLHFVWGYWRWNIVSSLVIGAVGTTFTIIYEGFIALNPMIPPRIFKDRTASLGYLTTWCRALVLWAYAYFITLYFVVCKSTRSLAPQKLVDVSIATALVSFFTSLGEAFGLAIGNAVFQNRWDMKLKKNIEEGLIPEELIVGGKMAENIGKALDGFPQDVQDIYRGMMADDIGSLWVVVTVFAGIALVGFIISKDIRLDGVGFASEDVAGIEHFEVNSEEDGSKGFQTPLEKV
ncbi:hypothetical protein EYC80_005397 [Monilinia laxa]|uniref:Major facilitator superfamily (MFS) profile domain-containing protein n=1 Tax=Monilinia laxa TaxID=61186 RepID=A0A5N6KK27_MONLA|nr:hypothetical protein EYC80_005397 [Monilinia laxa]